jgi:pimeloyl-ACP methyl ester carboxylesterase
MIAEPEPLYFESTGTGPPLVFAHGFSGSARNWRPQIRAFRGQNRVLVYDQRGHARSPAPHATPDRYSRAAFVADVAEILDREAISRAVACGLSLGAGVMLAFALAHPERVRGLVLASFPAGLGRAGAFSGSAQAMASVLESDGVEVAGARFVWGSESGLDERGAALVRQGFVEHDPLALAQILRGVLGEVSAMLDEPALDERLAMPVLLVAGSRDTGSLEATRRLASRLPHARVELIEGAGHVVNLSATAAFNEILGDFLVDLPD